MAGGAARSASARRGRARRRARGAPWTASATLRAPARASAVRSRGDLRGARRRAGRAGQRLDDPWWRRPRDGGRRRRPLARASGQKTPRTVDRWPAQASPAPRAPWEGMLARPWATRAADVLPPRGARRARLGDERGRRLVGWPRIRRTPSREPRSGTSRRLRSALRDLRGLAPRRPWGSGRGHLRANRRPVDPESARRGPTSRSPRGARWRASRVAWRLALPARRGRAASSFSTWRPCARAAALSRGGAPRPTGAAGETTRRCARRSPRPRSAARASSSAAPRSTRCRVDRVGLGRRRALGDPYCLACGAPATARAVRAVHSRRAVARHGGGARRTGQPLGARCVGERPVAPRAGPAAGRCTCAERGASILWRRLGARRRPRQRVAMDSRHPGDGRRRAARCSFAHALEPPHPESTTPRRARATSVGAPSRWRSITAACHAVGGRRAGRGTRSASYASLAPLATRCGGARARRRAASLTDAANGGAAPAAAGPAARRRERRPDWHADARAGGALESSAEDRVTTRRRSDFCAGRIRRRWRTVRGRARARRGSSRRKAPAPRRPKTSEPPASFTLVRGGGRARAARASDRRPAATRCAPQPSRAPRRGRGAAPTPRRPFAPRTTAGTRACARVRGRAAPRSWSSSSRPLGVPRLVEAESLRGGRPTEDRSRGA